MSGCTYFCIVENKQSSLPVVSLYNVIISSLPRSVASVSLPLTQQVNHIRPARRNAVQIDQSRAQALKQRVLNLTDSSDPPHDDPSPEPVTNAIVIYVASVGVGSPPTYYDLIVDTGSSNTWVGANKQYVHTSTSKSGGDVVEVMYGSGFFAGQEYTDRVSFTPSLVIHEQGIGVASVDQGFQNIDGILGIGPPDLTVGTLVLNHSAHIPTVVDNLYAQGTISNAVLGISFNPVSSNTSGVLSFGGPDPTKYTGDITYAPITSTEPASRYWGIDSTATYGNTVIMSRAAGIVDTGTTLILLPSDAFQAYKSATGAVEDEYTGLLRITNDQYANLEDLVFNIGGTNFAMTPNAQIWPRSLNDKIGGTGDGIIYLIVADMGDSSESGLDFILGYAFLERFYSVYDTIGKCVGIATTPFTLSNTN